MAEQGARSYTPQREKRTAGQQPRWYKEHTPAARSAARAEPAKRETRAATHPHTPQQLPATPATPPRIGYRRRQTPTGPKPAASRPGHPSVPTHSWPTKGVRPPQRCTSCRRVRRRRPPPLPPPTPPPPAPYLPGGRSRRRHRGAATDHTSRPRPTKVAPGGSHAHAAAAAPSGTAGGTRARVGRRGRGEGVCPQVVATPTAAPRGSGEGGKSSTSSTRGNSSRVYSTRQRARGKEKKMGVTEAEKTAHYPPRQRSPDSAVQPASKARSRAGGGGKAIAALGAGEGAGRARGGAGKARREVVDAATT